MNQSVLLQREEEIMTQYRAFLDEVQNAFNKHCDEIKAETTRKMTLIPESDQAGRRKVLDEQKAALDRTLAELKQLLNQRGTEMRKQLEKIASIREEQTFQLDNALATY